MAQNTVPKPIAELLDLGQHNLSGIKSTGAAIGLLQYTEANFEPKVDALAGKQNDFNTARAQTAAAKTDLAAAVDGMRAICLIGRKILSISWGDTYSAVWTQGGWNHNSTEVPRDAAALLSLCGALKKLLTDHPEYVVDTPKITFTPAALQAALDAAGTAQGALDTKEAAQTAAMTARTVDEAALRTAIRGLIDVLDTLMGPNDANWDKFGLNRPGATVTPAQPGVPTLAKGAPGTVTAEIAPVPGMTYVRWFTQLVGVDAEFRFFGRTSDPDVSFPGQPATGQLKVKAEAANEAGPGMASAVAEITL